MAAIMSNAPADFRTPLSPTSGDPSIASPMMMPTSPPQHPQQPSQTQFPQTPPQQALPPGLPQGPPGTSTALETSYVMQNGKPVRVVKVVHFVQAPPGGVESLSPEQQQLLMNEARANIQSQRSHRELPSPKTVSPDYYPQQQPQQQPRYGGYSGGAAGPVQHQLHNPVPPPPPSHTSLLSITRDPHSAWPANPTSANAQQRPTAGSLVMLNGGEPSNKSAIRLGEVGKVVEDDGSFVPFAVQGPRGDVDWYGEREVCMAAERQITKERQLLGDQIFARVAACSPTTAAKVTGMFLDGLDDLELAGLLADASLLQQRVCEAHTILQSYGVLPPPPPPPPPQPPQPCGGDDNGAAAAAQAAAQQQQQQTQPPQQGQEGTGCGVSPLLPCSPPPLPPLQQQRSDDVSLTSPFSFDTPSVLNGESFFNMSSPQMAANDIPPEFPCHK